MAEEDGAPPSGRWPARCEGAEGDGDRIKAGLPGASPLKSRFGRSGGLREMGRGNGEDSFPGEQGGGE